MSKELKRMQELAGVPVKKETESLNEHYVAGGIVGVGAVNQIPPRDKSDYEMAFEHFMNEGEEKEEKDVKEGMYEEDDVKESYYEEDDTMEEAVGIDASAEAIRGAVRGMIKKHSNDADLGAAVRAKFSSLDEMAAGGLEEKSAGKKLFAAFKKNGLKPNYIADVRKVSSDGEAKDMVHIEPGEGSVEVSSSSNQDKIAQAIKSAGLNISKKEDNVGDYNLSVFTINIK